MICTHRINPACGIPRFLSRFARRAGLVHLRQRFVHRCHGQKKAPAIAGQGKLSRAERHQSSALSALLHHAGPNASEVAVVTVRGLVRLCQRVVRRCHRSLQIGKGDTYPTSNSWRGPVRSLSTSFAEGEFHRRPRSSQQVEGSEADDWAKAIAGGSEEVVG